MTKFRAPWLALLGGVTLIVMSMSVAFAGKPDGTNRGLQVSAYVHSLVGADEETDTETADENETETDEDTEVETEDSSASDHGQCVAEVATDEEATGGDNENHGGAVSEAARVTCWEGTDHATKHADKHGGDGSDD